MTAFIIGKGNIWLLVSGKKEDKLGMRALKQPNLYLLDCRIHKRPNVEVMAKDLFRQ